MLLKMFSKMRNINKYLIGFGPGFFQYLMDLMLEFVYSEEICKLAILLHK